MAVGTSRRFSIFVAFLVLLSIGSSALTLVAMRRIEVELAAVAEKSFPSVLAAIQLENALLEQRGLMIRALVDPRKRDWLQELEWRRPQWRSQFAQVRAAATRPQERAILQKLEASYQRYDDAREAAVLALQRGDLTRARDLASTDVVTLGADAHGLCEQLVIMNQMLVAEARARARAQVLQANVIVVLGALLTALSGTVLLVLLLRNVLLPLRRLAERAPGLRGDSARDEILAVADSMASLAHKAAEAEASLEESRDRLHRAERLATLGKAAACIAHEVRNPLQAMSMRLYSIRTAAAHDPVLARRCDVFEEEIRRLDGIVTHFIDFARPPDLRPEPTEIAQVIEGALELLHDQFEGAHVQVTFENGQRLPQVRCDREQLRQVFLNLLSNSLHAMPTGGAIRITECVESSGRSSWVVVRVQDNGPGLPEPVRAHLFQPFASSRPAGAGLGLCIASSIVERHGGRLELESSGAGGTTFALRVPAGGA